MTPELIEEARQRAASMLEEAGVRLSEQERAALEVTDLGLGRFEDIGLVLHVYVNTDRYCAKELVLCARQTCPEHRHPPVPEAGDPGKMETFRVRRGRCLLYVPGHGDRNAIQARIPVGSERSFTVFHEIELRPGDQHTVAPNTLHWFQAGDEGAVVSEFSSTSRDELDVFTDPAVKRVPDSAEDCR